jgi:hypothetical protein
MSKPAEEYRYTRDHLAKLSGWSKNRIDKDVSRDGFQVQRIEEVAVWLAANGPPEIRRRMAQHLLKDTWDGLYNTIHDHLMESIFNRNSKQRLDVAKRKSPKN